MNLNLTHLHVHCCSVTLTYSITTDEVVHLSLHSRGITFILIFKHFYPQYDAKRGNHPDSVGFLGNDLKMLFVIHFSI